MVAIRRVYRRESSIDSGTPSRRKNPLKMNQPRMKPETKRMEYHLSAKPPIRNISGLTFQLTKRKSIMGTGLGDDYSWMAATPGSTLPSIASRRAPPPVET